MANTFELIASASGTGSSGIVTFSSIPQTYTDLVFYVSARAGNDIDNNLKVNGNTINGGKNLYGTGSAAGSQNSTSGGSGIWLAGWSGATASTFGNGTFYFPNYTSSNYKSVSIDTVNENNATAAYQSLTAAIWNTTSPITSVTFETTDTSTRFYQTYSTFYLYGVKNA